MTLAPVEGEAGRDASGFPPHIHYALPAQRVFGLDKI